MTRTPDEETARTVTLHCRVTPEFVATLDAARGMESRSSIMRRILRDSLAVLRPAAHQAQDGVRW
ncbi:hypothetical protein [Cellulomonas iranensis]|uniref:Ribose 1,5-bisphosphokinase PhnN n=1 Tax=Cellulomonas iranensis TaxID=76862 RepID=A0ABU0GFZ7_9CELL|nr:hypothetical protein [Cellulomonas iranensis]MDQ0424280.1 ribose 1,5-bisphosphokinase PhnN [Cellulomonas iranensis]